MRISDLTRRLPDEQELRQLWDLMITESDRGAALIAGAYVEAALQVTIAAWFEDDLKVIKSMFDDGDAPLGTFAAKIKAGRALGIYGPVTQRTLDQVRVVRNVFAHALRPVGFDTPAIADVVRSLDPVPMPEETEMNPVRVRFLATAHNLFRRLYEVAVKHGGREMIVELP